MPVAAGISAAGSVAGAGLGILGSETASKQQANALQTAVGSLQGMFNTAYGAINPVIQTGLGAAQSVLPTLQSLLTPGANMNATLSQIPGFQFAQNWGQKAVTNQGTTQGLGGNVLAAGSQYATGLAQQGYGNIVSMLQNLFSSGEGSAASAAQGLGGTAASFGNSLSTALTGIGGAQAAGTLGATNAAASGISGGTNALSSYMLLSKLFPNLGAGANAGGATGIYAGGVT